MPPAYLTPDVAAVPGVDPAAPGVGLLAAAVESDIARFLGWDPRPGPRTVTLDGNDESVVYLPTPSKHIASVTEIRCDPRGYAPGGFGDNTVQAPGIDYFAAPHELARLVRLRRDWPGWRERAEWGSLADTRTPGPGAVRVTYVVGPVDATIVAAGAVELSARMETLNGFGAELSTTLAWHTRSITMFGSDGADGASRFVSPFTAKYLGGLRRKAVW